MRYIYTMEYYSAIKRNEIGSFVEMWMDLESVIQSDINQKEKNQSKRIKEMRGGGWGSINKGMIRGSNK